MALEVGFLVSHEGFHAGLEGFDFEFYHAFRRDVLGLVRSVGGGGYKVGGDEVFEEGAEEFVEFVASLPEIFCVGWGIVNCVHVRFST